ncbi:divalent-cation tolerance protein CutA [Alteromonas gilva]|uniref:Divalent-cation tolerance protein CutA n=1 Tax=Alteromonas gilva TaxID=2987522 RepID=A0ABT5KXC4_9ALTE|nr:divalent-cation tolerance protein CutA [Alteromonas gilva]MDC8829424.1 divalent-cation tolerance protein CutA [Alteromonas gilva]
MSNVCIVFCTTDTRDNAETIADALIAARAAACVQIVPGITAVYRWQDQVVKDEEFQLVIKTTQQHVDAAKRVVDALHNYDVPQWVVVDAQHVSAAYGNWVNQELNVE